jgi:hypothetical protein
MSPAVGRPQIELGNAHALSTDEHAYDARRNDNSPGTRCAACAIGRFFLSGYERTVTIHAVAVPARVV